MKMERFWNENGTFASFFYFRIKESLNERRNDMTEFIAGATALITSLTNMALGAVVTIAGLMGAVNAIKMVAAQDENQRIQSQQALIKVAISGGVALSSVLIIKFALSFF